MERVPIKTIIFDMGRVIVDLDFDRTYQAVEARTGLSRDEMSQRLREGEFLSRFERGLIEPRAFVEEFGGRVGWAQPYDDFCRFWSSIFLPEPLLPVGLFERLKQRYRLLLLSNTNAIHVEMIRATYPHLEHIHHCVMSHEVGVLKPAAAIYEEALRHAHCAPDECFFTDDMEENVAGARRLGIDAEQFRGYEALLGELGRRGVLLDAS
jgi:putative hydrolase of the HAD superfamily